MSISPNGRSSSESKRVAIYCRVSSDQQEDNYSLATQEAACRAYCETNGWEIITIESEVGSGYTLDRHKLNAVREAARRREIDAIVIHSYDRLSRNQVHQVLVEYEADQNGAQIISATENFENDATGRFLRSTKSFIAEFEREKLIERTTRGKRARVEAGKPLTNGKPLYGYQWADKSKSQLVIDPSTAPIVQRIFRDAAAGVPLRRITAQLMDEGIPTPSGKSWVWQPSTVQRILANSAYAGEAYGWCWRRLNGSKGQSFDADNAIKLPAGTVPPLVDIATWQAVRSILERNKKRSRRNAKNPESALLRGGYVMCGHCGHPMRARPTSDGKVEYVCVRNSHVPGACTRHSIRAPKLDEAVWDRVRAILIHPELIEQEIERQRNDDPVATDLAAVEGATREIERKRVNLARALAQIDDQEASAPIISELQSLAERMRSLESERDRLDQQRSQWAQAQSRLETLTSWCSAIAIKLDHLSWEEKRTALDALGIQAQVYRTSHDPRYVITADIKLDIGDSVYSTT